MRQPQSFQRKGGKTPGVYAPQQAASSFTSTRHQVTSQTSSQSTYGPNTATAPGPHMQGLFPTSQGQKTTSVTTSQSTVSSVTQGLQNVAIGDRVATPQQGDNSGVANNLGSNSSLSTQGSTSSGYQSGSGPQQVPTELGQFAAQSQQAPHTQGNKTPNLGAIREGEDILFRSWFKWS